ncbi:MAG TPA: aminotransferase class III-fold pyridoxal phosphate-dependent enzyme, partial [Synergistaceae bacterium]|nr:aminotransferase class III-fold pyridoxal phosphate-dependent enzyme [Synergistaceae bacterium]
DIILIADEVQTGLGRTGAVYSSFALGLEPDIITLAKPLAGGLPLSATLIPGKINDLLKTGDHGSTFGGGPVTTAVASHLWDIITDGEFLAEVRRKGEVLARALGGLAETHSSGPLRVGEVRGRGMLRGLEILAPEDRTPGVMKAILAAAQERGLLLLRSGTNVVRIAPPLVIGDGDLLTGVGILGEALGEVFTGEL